MDKKTTTVTVFNEQYSLTSNLPKEETEATKCSSLPKKRML